MKPTQLAFVVLLFASLTNASAASWTTCDFEDEGTVRTDSFAVYGDRGGENIVNDSGEVLSGLGEYYRGGQEMVVTWRRTGNTFHLFAVDEEPQLWLLSFSSHDRTAVSLSGGVPVYASTCRAGRE